MKHARAHAMLLLAVLLPCCAFGFDPSLDAAGIHFDHLTSADGLSHSDVRAIVQDRQGFMWFGTWLGGLNRYDGYTFKVYRHDPNDNRSLGSDSIRNLYVDRRGVLWIATQGGVDQYDQETDSFIHHDRDADNHPIAQPNFFYEEKSGRLWVASAAGLSRFDQVTGTFRRYRPDPSEPMTFGNADVWDICEDKTSGLLWLSANGGVTILDPSNGHVAQYKNIPNDPAGSANFVEDIFQDQKGTLWISTQKGLDRFDPRTHSLNRYLHDPNDPSTLSDDYVMETYEDRAGRFWVTTNNGLNLMDRAHGTFTRYLHDANNPHSLSSNIINIHAIFEDSAGTLWIGTRSGGVDRLQAGAKAFTTYGYNPQDANSLSSEIVSGLDVDPGGDLWIGTTAGVDHWNGSAFTHYLARPNDPSSLSPGAHHVAIGPRGVVWTGSYGGGLDRLDGNRVKHFRHNPKDTDSPANDNIASLVPDAAGGLWIAVYGKGMDYFDGQHFTHFSPDPAHAGSLPDRWVQPFLLDERGTLWIGTAGMGLVGLDNKTRKFSTYLLDSTQPGNHAVNWVQDIYSDGTNLWVASINGLFRFDLATRTFSRHYTEKDGLGSNSAVGVIGDIQGNVWVSTIRGLSRLEPRTGTFRNYDVNDGLQGNEFSPVTRARAPDGRLFFGGPHGLSVFDPAKLIDNPRPPPVILTEFDLFNEPAAIGGKNSPLQKAINFSSEITLRHNQSVFRLQFAALDFTAPQKNQYAYILQPFDERWQYTDAKRRWATYTNLDPGDYTFRVKASNNDGVWNEQGVALHIRILPPWWNTLWFRALCAAGGLGLLWALHELRLRQVAAEFNVRLEERVGERTRIARELHDTLLQSFQALLLLFQTGIQMLPQHPDDARRVLEDAVDRASRAIAEGRDAILGLRTSTVEKNDLSAALRTIAEELAKAQNSQAPTFRMVVEGAPRELHPISRDELYRLSTEALRNAFRHASARNIEVEIRYDEKYLRVRIRDDGKGIDPQILHRNKREGHYGLPGMRERAEAAGGRLAIWTELDSGTEVDLTIPGARAYLKPPRPFWLFGKRSATEVDEKEKNRT